MRFLGRMFIVLGIVVIIPGGLTAFRDLSQANRHDARIDELVARRDTVRERLHAVNLRYRGYQQSIPTMPDSVKKAQSGIISRTFREFNKQVRSLELEQKELTRLMGREETKKGEVIENTWVTSGGLAGGGGALMLLGFVLTRRAGRLRVSG